MCFLKKVSSILFLGKVQTTSLVQLLELLFFYLAFRVIIFSLAFRAIVFSIGVQSHLFSQCLDPFFLVLVFRAIIFNLTFKAFFFSLQRSRSQFLSVQRWQFYGPCSHYFIIVIISIISSHKLSLMSLIHSTFFPLYGQSLSLSYHVLGQNFRLFFILWYSSLHVATAEVLMQSSLIKNTKIK